MFIGLKFIIARAFKVKNIFGFHSMCLPSHVTTLPSSNILGKGGYYFFSWREIKWKYHQKKMAQRFDTQKYCQPLNDPCLNFENVQWDTADTCISQNMPYNRFYFIRHQINLCQHEQLCVVPSSILAPKCCLQPKIFSIPLYRAPNCQIFQLYGYTVESTSVNL